jgi:hypothetical protein
MIGFRNNRDNIVRMGSKSIAIEAIEFRPDIRLNFQAL